LRPVRQSTVLLRDRAFSGEYRHIGRVAHNLASAGAFDSLEPNRRKVKWEIGLRYRPINSQLALPLPVQQDMVDLECPGDWESMKDEYNVLSLSLPDISWPVCARVFTEIYPAVKTSPVLETVRK